MSFFVVFLALAHAAAPVRATGKPVSVPHKKAKGAKAVTVGKKIALVLPPPIASLPKEEPSYPMSGQSFDERILVAHNEERQSLGQKPLRWSPQLAADAKTWADHLAETSTFEHAAEVPGKPQGENLWTGTKLAYGPEQMVGAWIDEKKIYKPGLFPNVSTTGIWEQVGHYTQLIWYNTTDIGCAKAANQQDDYLVCRYFPAGNWDEENPLGPNGGKK
jgi:uncharacterized protein YkwD